MFAEKSILYSPWLQSTTFKVISTLISLLFCAGIITVVYKIILLNKEEAIDLEEVLFAEGAGEERLEHWESVKNRIDSTNSSDWKMAIMEADSLVDKIFKQIGTSGKDMGERLNNIEPSDFDNLQNVWDAHKLRNRIAHDANFELNKESALNALEKYERALKELKYI